MFSRQPTTCFPDFALVAREKRWLMDFFSWDFYSAVFEVLLAIYQGKLLFKIRISYALDFAVKRVGQVTIIRA